MVVHRFPGSGVSPVLGMRSCAFLTEGLDLGVLKNVFELAPPFADQVVYHRESGQPGNLRTLLERENRRDPPPHRAHPHRHLS